MDNVNQVAILGRQPEISLAELESLFGSGLVSPVGDYAALVDSPVELPQIRLGGTMKSAKLICQLKNSDINAAFEYINSNLASVFGNKTDGKLKIGFSVYGFDIKRETLLKRTLATKKLLKDTGQSVRIVENKSPQMSSAQVLYNKLTDDLGFELLIIKDGADAILAQTYAVQDIDAYGERDFGRPKRDARVGMLPPKLAQIIINLAVGQIEDRNKAKTPNTIHQPPSTIVDPFCGTGVVIQEAVLMGLGAVGSDIDPRMVEYSHENLEWLAQKWQITDHRWQIIQADATDHKWQPGPSFIACETYLGRAFSAIPSPQVLQKVIQDVDTIHKKFLQNVARQTEKGFRLCIAVPAWNTPHGFKHLKALDHLEELGYTRLCFELAGPEELIYHRPDQIVARELVVLLRI